MKRGYRIPLMILIAASFVLAAVPPAPADDYSYARVVRLSLVDGDVQLARPQSEDQSEAAWEQAVVNVPIQQGYSIATGQGRAEIEFESGATARLAENSLLQFTELALSNGGRITQLTLTQGTATFYANLSRDDSFVVATPHLQAVIPKNARFRVDVSDDSSQVSAFKGEVEVDSSAGTTRLTKDHSLNYRANDPDQVAVDRISGTDDWDRWVADRDEVIHTASNNTLQYVSSPYNYGLSDLYSYGSWYQFGGYGFCWRPSGVGLGWSPFWSGRWAFLPGFGWTWVSYEPWGWLPYHYGRWAFSPTLGWLWVPGQWHQWQPALVSWVRVGDHVGWVPMHPGDRPGRTPVNLQQGVIVGTSSHASGTSAGNAGKVVTVGKNFEILRNPPQGFAETLPSKGKYIGRPLPGPAGGNGAQPKIVYDPKEHKYVNNPTGGAGDKNTNPSGGNDAKVGMGCGGSAGKTLPKQDVQPHLPSNTGSSGPNVAPSKTSPPPPQPRVQTPPPPPPPHPQSMAPPHQQWAPPNRTESPHPAPAQHWQSTPSMSPPSSAPPRSSTSPRGGRG